MATTNVPITAEWTLAASSASDPVLISIGSGGTIEIALTADDSTQPAVVGHAITPGQGVTRDLVGRGSIWARAMPVNVGESAAAVLVVTA